MVEQHVIAEQWAEIERVIPITEGEGKTLILLLRSGFGGVIPADGAVRSKRGLSYYTGPKLMEDWDLSGAWNSWMTVTAIASNAGDIIQTGDMVAFSSRPVLSDRTKRIIEIDGQGWTTALDLYDTLLPAIGAPKEHGENINALVDSMIWGGINTLEPPYEVRIRGLRNELRWKIEQVQQSIIKQSVDFKIKRGHDPGVSIEIV